MQAGGEAGQRGLKKQASKEEIREMMRIKCVSRVRQERAGQLARLRAGGAHRVTTMQPEQLAGLARSLVHEEFAGHGDSIMACESSGADARPPSDFGDDVSKIAPEIMTDYFWELVFSQWLMYLPTGWD